MRRPYHRQVIGNNNKKISPGTLSGPGQRESFLKQFQPGPSRAWSSASGGLLDLYTFSRINKSWIAEFDFILKRVEAGSISCWFNQFSAWNEIWSVDWKCSGLMGQIWPLFYCLVMGDDRLFEKGRFERLGSHLKDTGLPLPTLCKRSAH